MQNQTIQIDSLSDDEINEMMSVTDISDKDIIGGVQDQDKDKSKTVVTDKVVTVDPKLAKAVAKSFEVKDLESFDDEDEIKTGPEKTDTDLTTKVEDTTDKKEKTVDTTSTEVDYTTAVKYLIQEGIFSDFEGSDTFEFNKDTFAELLKAQAITKVEDVWKEKLDTLGDVAKQLIEFEANNGDPRQLLSLFQEQRDIESYSLDTIEGQEEVVREYYERAGKTKSWIDKYVNSKKEEGEEAFKEEAEENKKLILDSIKESVEETKQAQKELEERRSIAEKQFNDNIKRFIHTDKTSDREKREMEKFFFEYKHTLSNGKKANDMMIKFYEIQNDPKKYYKFVKFLKNFDKFEDETKVANETKKQMFDFIKKSQGDLSKKTTIAPEFSGKNKGTNPFTN